MAIYVIEEEKLEEFKIKRRPTTAADTQFIQYHRLRPTSRVVRGLGGAALILQKLYGSNIENLINSFRDVFEYFREDDTVKRDIVLLDKWVKGDFQGQIELEDPPKLARMLNSNTKNYKKRMIKRLMKILGKKDPNITEDEAWEYFKRNYNRRFGELVKGNKNYIDPSQIVKPQPSKIKPQNQPQQTTQTQKTPPKPKTTPDKDIALLNQWFDNDLKGDLKFDNIDKVLKIIKSDKKYIIKKILEIRKKRKQSYKINSVLDEIMIWNNFAKRFNKSAGGEYLTTKDYINNLEK